MTAVRHDGPVEVARHRRGAPGNPVIAEAHDPQRQDKQGEREPRAGSAEEAAFLLLGAGAKAWLMETAATGARRVRPKMAEAIALAKLHGTVQVDRALGTAALTGRFAENDLIRILT